jgi:putative nucleotidyltransferase with HDIG domain
MSRVVRTSIDSGRFRPPLLPEVALNLSRVAEQRDVEIAQIEALVVKDPAVAGRVVSIANSALFSRGAKITSLRTAILRLGLLQVRDVAFQVVAQGKVFRVPSYADRMRELFDAAQAAGFLAREVCKQRGDFNDAAYLCGLLHDMGEANVLAMVAESCGNRADKVPDVQRLNPVIQSLHCEVGAWVCRQWNLPEEVIDAVLFHHEVERSEHSDGMAGVVAATDLLLRHVGIGTPWQPVTKADEHVFTRLGLPPDRVGHLLRFAEDLASDNQSWSAAAG